MEIYIIRHGETVWNAAGLLQGTADIELNEKGREAAEKCHKELQEVSFDCIFASPLKRALETAELIRGDRDIPIVTDDRLRELSFGTMEGQPYTKWMAEDSPYRSFFVDPAHYCPPPEGESLEHAKERAAAFLQEIVESNPAKYRRIMIVAHGALNKALMCRIEENDQAHYWGTGLQANCQASIFSLDASGYRKIAEGGTMTITG